MTSFAFEKKNSNTFKYILSIRFIVQVNEFAAFSLRLETHDIIYCFYYY